jgi:repressor LexA
MVEAPSTTDPRAEPLSEPQRKTMKVIRDFIGRMGYPPTTGEIAAALGITMPSAYQQIGIIARKGYIRREPGKARGIVVLREPGLGFQKSVLVPIVGSVAAGQPIFAEENVVGRVLVDGAFASKGRCFGLSVRGDSMIGAGINDGDIVVVRQQVAAENGDIVVALVRGEATVKRLSIQEERVELRPENPEYQPIALGLEDDFRILGKVVSVSSVEGQASPPKDAPRRWRRRRGKT